MKRKLKMGMVGGGRGAFIGAVHRMAAALDGECELVCGAFSSDPERSRLSGADLMLDPARVYGSYVEMFEKEKALPVGERMDFVTIVTPNNMHFPPAKMALENGFAVVCDKPMTLNLAEAKELAALVDRTGLTFALTHNYTGYPMVKQARAMVRSGALGAVRKVIVEYPQGWLATKVEDTDNKQASWRADPCRTGAANCMGDIGTHAENLAEYITGLTIENVCADLTTFVPGRALDDDGAVLLHFNGGARGVLFASQVCVGEENALRIRVYGETGGIDWFQHEPNTLVVRRDGRPVELYRTGGSYLDPISLRNTRLPMGHPEGFIEGFANIYRNFIHTVAARIEGRTPDPADLDFPGVHDGVRGMAFIETVVAASKSSDKWLPFSE